MTSEELENIPLIDGVCDRKARRLARRVLRFMRWILVKGNNGVKTVYGKSYWPERYPPRNTYSSVFVELAVNLAIAGEWEYLTRNEKLGVRKIIWGRKEATHD